MAEINRRVLTAALAVIAKGQDILLLPQTQDNLVVVSYVTDKGQKVAKSIDVVGTTR